MSKSEEQKMRDFFDNNENFREYVLKEATRRMTTPNEVLRMEMTHQYYLSALPGGCNYAL